MHTHIRCVHVCAVSYTNTLVAAISRIFFEKKKNCKRENYQRRKFTIYPPTIIDILHVYMHIHIFSSFLFFSFLFIFFFFFVISILHTSIYIYIYIYTFVYEHTRRKRLCVHVVHGYDLFTHVTCITERKESGKETTYTRID